MPLGLAAFAIGSDDGTREIWQRLRMDDRSGIALDQRLSHIYSTDFGSSIARRRKDRNPLLGVVRISGQNMHGIMLQQPLCDSTHALAPEPGKGRAGQLNHAALFCPL